MGGFRWSGTHFNSGDALTRQDLLLFANVGDSLADAETGIISVTAFFDHGDFGRFIGQAFSVADYGAPTTIPEPSTLALLAPVFAWIGYRRRCQGT